MDSPRTYVLKCVANKGFKSCVFVSVANAGVRVRARKFGSVARKGLRSLPGREDGGITIRACWKRGTTCETARSFVSSVGSAAAQPRVGVLLKRTLIVNAEKPVVVEDLMITQRRQDLIGEFTEFCFGDEL